MKINKKMGGENVIKHKKILFVLIVNLLIVLSVSSALLAGEIKELTLSEVLELALENNFTLKSSNLDIAKAENDLKLAWQNLWPQINLNSSYTRLDEGMPVPTGDFQPIPTGLSYPIPGFNTEIPIMTTIPIYEEGSANMFNTQITVQQPLFMGGKVMTGIEMAKDGVNLTRLQTDKAVIDTLYNVLQVYFGVLMAEEMVHIQENSLKLIEEHGRIVQANYDAGMVLKSDLLQVEIEKRKVLLGLKSAQNNVYLTQRQFSQLVGLKDTNFVLIRSNWEPDVNYELDVLYEEALLNRSDLNIFSLNQEMLQRNLKIEKRSNWPNLVMMGSYIWNGDKLSFNDGSWNVTISGSMQLFDGGISKKKQDGLEIQLEKLELSKESLSEMIKLEIEEALLKVEEARDSIALQKLSKENTLENYRLASQRYQAGVGANIDVLNAQIILQQTEISLVQSQFQFQLSIYKLLYKTGMLSDYCEEVIHSEN